MSAMAVRVLCMLKSTSAEDQAGFAGAERSSETVRAYEVKLKGITISGATRNQAGQALIAMSMSPSLTRTACTIAARAFEAVALDGERGFESAGGLTLRFSLGEGQRRSANGPVRIDA